MIKIQTFEDGLGGTEIHYHGLGNAWCSPMLYINGASEGRSFVDSIRGPETTFEVFDDGTVSISGWVDEQTLIDAGANLWMMEGIDKTLHWVSKCNKTRENCWLSSNKFLYQDIIMLESQELVEIHRPKDENGWTREVQYWKVKLTEKGEERLKTWLDSTSGS